MGTSHERTWFADLVMSDGTPICAEFGWDDSAYITEAWRKADEDDANAPLIPLSDEERWRLETALSERGDPRAEDVFDDDEFPFGNGGTV